MNRDRLNWGLVLLFIGIMWLLSNLGIIAFYWSSLWRFWPVFLIIIGVNLLVPKEGIGNFVSVLVTILALVFVGYQVSRPSPNRLNNNIRWHQEDGYHENDSEDVATGEIREANFTAPFESGIKEANLEIKGGAIEYKIDGETNDLFRAETKSNFGGHVLQKNSTDSTVNLSFRMKNFKKRNWHLEDGENSTHIALNTKPLWNITIDMGAGAAEFDLSHYKIKQLNMKGGAASFEAKLGMPVKETIVNAESGVASIEIKIPEAAACRITVNSGLSSKEFDGFIEQSDGTYTTANYEQATAKFNMHLKGGLSSFSVSRY